MEPRGYIYVMTVSAMMMGACKKSYTPDVVRTDHHFLVVEGFISTGSDSTIIKLSRTVQVQSTARPQPELAAAVNIVSDAGQSYALTETGNGYYKAPGLKTSAPGKYGLKIMTAEGRVYMSDLVPAKNSPPIDSVYYRIEGDGLRLYADTHDPLNKTTFYRWEYTETYIFHTAFNSMLYVNHNVLHGNSTDTVLLRPPGDQIYYCWRSDTSSTLVLNSTAKLSSDVVTGNVIAFIPSHSEKLNSRYSILVKQYALTSEAFNYYQLLKKNTEQLGSVFDAQPTELPGNIHCTSDPTEAVIGYISAGSVSQTRIFVDKSELPPLPSWTPDDLYGGCKIEIDLFKRYYNNGVNFPDGSYINDVQDLIYTGIHIPVDPVGPPGGPIIGYTASLPNCVDCTLRGTNIKPVFWR